MVYNCCNSVFVCGKCIYLRLEQSSIGYFLDIISVIAVLKSIFMMEMCSYNKCPTNYYCILQSFANPEDLALSKATEVNFHDPDVERVRRAHRNDLENILPYLLIALAYITTAPNIIVARLLFCIVAISRIFHTAVYAFRPIPQPSRAIAFFVPFTITLYMTFCVIIQMAKYV
ncbi:microsomal glutathione S-transferase 1-like isoform X2 [Musca autumnalis]|uniref:microsomal glutathione S-transferase 1-like isoform X2 n=1 Tax=Musca autumnalis TaxID=221902 RepID=UPI003CEAEAF1